MTDQARATIGRRSFVGVGVASLISAGVGFAVILIVPNVLDKAATGVFLAFWSFLFAWFGILGGLSSETTRAVHASDRIVAAESERREPRMLAVGLVLGVAVGVLLWATSLWWAPIVFLSPDNAWLAAPLSCSVALFSGHATIVGILGGRLEWGTFARLVIGDSVLRFVLVGGAALVAATVAGFAVAASIASVTWLIGLLFSPTLRRAARARSDVGLGDFLRRVGHACLASGSSAVLVVGFPVILTITSTRAEYIAAAPLLVAVTFTRAPLLIPLNAYQGVAIAHFVNNRSAGLKTLFPIARLIALIAVVGAVLGYLLGPWLILLVYPPDYVVSGWAIGGLVLAAAMLALLTLTGALCLALEKHRSFSLGWLAATALAVVILLLPFEGEAGTELRTVLALGLGPLAGLAIHLVTLRRAGRQAGVEA
ncbi:lipopolysaccharide biosynthesis protein [Herbiconiux liangxiaofengii]|uniref:lipopolysaccharide biosynthesis protein n=1 Tax=Herbiconiux liangxiaofengii TaxID=3342795 RepID=UPI0035B769CB